VKKLLVVGIIILFIGVGIQPAFAVDIPQKEEIEPKDYLFETIVAIANNPEVRELFEEYSNNIYDLDYNYKGIFLQILFNNPKLLFSKLFTKPKITKEYLNSAFNEGCDIVNIIGEDKTLKMIKSVKLSNPDIVNDLHNILLNDKELSNRISTLAELNEELKPNKPFEDIPFICVILIFLFIRYVLRVEFVNIIIDFIENPDLISILWGLLGVYLNILFIVITLGLQYDCLEIPYL
jgi:hypothetical protein